MTTSKVKYLGQLRTSAIHLKSKNEIITDAPTDNNGKGEAFSPTDTVATALASCMLTIMGIKARDHGWSIENSMAEVTKVMTSNPRAIGEIHVNLNIIGVKEDDKAQTILSKAALNCPVAKSLATSIQQKITFNWI